jgi:hypothetical protein
MKSPHILSPAKASGTSDLQFQLARVWYHPHIELKIRRQLNCDPDGIAIWRN